MLHEGIRRHFDFSSKSPPMAVLSSVLNALSCFHPQLLDITDDNSFQKAVARIMAKVRTIAAFPIDTRWAITSPTTSRQKVQR